jgi:hypothetical protein
VRSCKAVIAASLLTASAAIAQNAIQNEIGAPHEDLGRARENISAVLCRAPFRKSEESKFDNEFVSRMRAVHERVSIEYGAEVANREYMSVLPCRTFRSRTTTYKALMAARASFLTELEKWEARYSIEPVKSKR